MDRHLLGGLMMGGLALLVGAAWIVGAIRRVRERALSGPTYEATGGPVYAVFQIGCAGLLIIAGIVILAVTAFGSSR